MKEPASYFEVAELIAGFLNNELTQEQRQRLYDWIAADEQHRRLWERLTDPGYLQERYAAWGQADPDRAWAALQAAVARPAPRRAAWKKAWRAAAVWVPLLMLGALGWWWLSGRHRPEAPPQASAVQGRDIVPRGKVARLQLANGQLIALDGSGQDSLREEDGTTVYKRGSRLSYDAGRTSQGTLVYNTVFTPRGGEYQIRLADGTAVWLNAASSLRFPTQFSGSERRVYLSGEAYFEVSSDARRPFTVVTGDLEVAVLGTRFDLCSYTEDAGSRVVLAQGAVRVKALAMAGKPGAETLLAPGQEARWTAGREGLQVGPANVEGALAWTEGLFLFDGESLGSIMRRLARWYDVDVVYEKGVDKQFHFTGRIQKYDSIGGILHLLELTGKVKFRMQGRRLYVGPKP